ncbi:MULTISPECIES: glycosyltransferase [Klebsiella]|uniref:glycosyltransferase n=1 Tax=Klebsiella TaxID=570 RepID=UPI0022E4F5B3|nr:glycosyltransferase [Klebsiella variicola]
MLIVNLTTTHSRLDLCSITLFSLLNQSVSPDKIRVWISEESYLSDQGVKKIPDFLLKLNKFNDIVEFVYTKNTGPYRKIFPALKIAGENDVLVYADDDVVYHKEWLEKLFSTFNKYQRMNVVAARVRLKKKNIFNKYKSYVAYPICLTERTLSRDYIITGLGGAILMKKHIASQYIYMEDYIEIAPKTDDLWISEIITRSKTNVTTCPDAICYFTEINHSNNALSANNNPVLSGGVLSLFLKKSILKLSSYFGVNKTNNDVAAKKIYKHFHDAL